MATEKQKAAARKNIARAREIRSERAHGTDVPQPSEGLSTAEKDRLDDAEFAFPKERKEPDDWRDLATGGKDSRA
jgi:hypothetical protein